MSDLVFYTNPMSRSRIVRWMLEEIGAPYDTAVLDYGADMNTPDYLALNPMGKVPAITHRGTVVTETAAICCYLAEVFPEAHLAPPPGSPDRGAFLRWMFFGAGPVDAAVTNASFGWVPESPRDRGRLGYGSLERVADVLAARLAEGPWLTGDTFSAVDVFLGAQIVWGRDFGEMPDRPGFAAYAERIKARPAALRANEIDDALMRNAAPHG
ncbi:MAG: glutathione S-transferase family protein [Pseudomonadota bacterium]